MDIRKVTAAGLAVVALAVSAGCAPTTSASGVAPAPASLPSQVRATRAADPLAGSDLTTRASLLVDGVAKPLKNGQKVAVGKGLLAEVWFTPYPPAGSTDMTIQVFDPVTKEGLDNGQVSLRYDMPEMGHGTIVQRMTPRGSGAYQTRLNLFMLGTYQIAVDVRTADAGGTVAIELAMSLSE